MSYFYVLTKTLLYIFNNIGGGRRWLFWCCKTLYSAILPTWGLAEGMASAKFYPQQWSSLMESGDKWSLLPCFREMPKSTPRRKYPLPQVAKAPSKEAMKSPARAARGNGKFSAASISKAVSRSLSSEVNSGWEGRKRSRHFSRAHRGSSWQLAQGCGFLMPSAVWLGLRHLKLSWYGSMLAKRQRQDGRSQVSCIFSGGIRNRDWRRLMPKESTRGRKLCEIELLSFESIYIYIFRNGDQVGSLEGGHPGFIKNSDVSISRL